MIENIEKHGTVGNKKYFIQTSLYSDRDHAEFVQIATFFCISMYSDVNEDLRDLACEYLFSDLVRKILNWKSFVFEHFEHNELFSDNIIFLLIFR